MTREPIGADHAEYRDLFTVAADGATTDAPGFRRMFAPGRLTIGLFFPIEAFVGDRPTMSGQEVLAQRAEALGVAALWVRDVPLRDPTFGDVGQVYDPWVFLGYLTALTRDVALATGAIVLPLRHPLHTAKAAASTDRLSGGRLVLGVAGGDRPAEFPAFGVAADTRAARFREHLAVLRRALGEEFPAVASSFGRLDGVDLVPKPLGRGIPVLVTGQAGQALPWIAAHAEGWMMYPRPPLLQQHVVADWRAALAETADVRGGAGRDLTRPADVANAPPEWKPFGQSLYIDLAAEPDQPPTPIHLGYRLGRRALVALLETLRQIGVHHVALNLKYGRRPAGDVLEELGAHVLPAFPPVEAAPRPPGDAVVVAAGDPSRASAVAP